jgi:hypothetical protein
VSSHSKKEQAFARNGWLPERNRVEGWRTLTKISLATIYAW